MILEMDIGNTRCKWRLIDQQGTRVTGNAVDRSISIEQQLSSIESGSHVDQIRVSSVAGAEFDGLLSTALESRFGIKPNFATSDSQTAGVTNSYSQPERMGVDRWLAMLAAFSAGKGPVMVVDCGSALTIDLVDASGLHQGGYIIAGLNMQKQVLLQGTDRVRFHQEEIDGSSIKPGCSTAQAVNHGALLTAVGAIEYASQDCRDLDDWRCYLTGGDSTTIKNLLSFPVIINQDLVLDGLALALP